MSFIKLSKESLMRIHLVLCAHKGKGGSIKPCRAQEEAGGVLRHQQIGPEELPSVSSLWCPGRKVKLCKMLKVLEVKRCLGKVTGLVLRQSQCGETR